MRLLLALPCLCLLACDNAADGDWNVVIDPGGAAEQTFDMHLDYGGIDARNWASRRLRTRWRHARQNREYRDHSKPREPIAHHHDRLLPLSGIVGRLPEVQPAVSQDRLERAAQRLVPEHESVAERLVGQHALATQ